MLEPLMFSTRCEAAIISLTVSKPAAAYTNKLQLGIKIINVTCIMHINVVNNHVEKLCITWSAISLKSLKMKGLVECKRVNHLWLKSDHTAIALCPSTFMALIFSTNLRSVSSPDTMVSLFNYKDIAQLCLFLLCRTAYTFADENQKAFPLEDQEHPFPSP